MGPISYYRTSSAKGDGRRDVPHFLWAVCGSMAPLGGWVRPGRYPWLTAGATPGFGGRPVDWWGARRWEFVVRWGMGIMCVAG